MRCPTFRMGFERGIPARRIRKAFSIMVASKAAKAATENSQEANSANETSVLPSVDWSGIHNVTDAVAALGLDLLKASDVLGDGSDFITDKNTLVNVPFTVLEWRFVKDEKSGNEYVNVHIMSPSGQRGRFNDGGTGVYAQLKQVTEQIGRIAIACPRGLRRSDYTKEGVGDATTYYLSS